MKQQPIVAFLYDFDKTLCTTDMQDYAFIPSLGMTPAEFWAEANGFGRRNRMDGILAYMYTMLRTWRAFSSHKRSVTAILRMMSCTVASSADPAR